MMRTSNRYKRLLRNREKRQQQKFLDRMLSEYVPTDAELQMSAIVNGEEDPIDGFNLEDAMQDLHFLAYCQEQDISYDDCNLARHYAAFQFKNQTGRDLYASEVDHWKEGDIVQAPEQEEEEEEDSWVFI